MDIQAGTGNRIILNIPGMHCGGCARTIEKALRSVSGVDAVSADAGRKIAEIDGSASSADLVAAVKTAGYEAEVATNVRNPEERPPAKSKCCCG